MDTTFGATATGVAGATVSAVAVDSTGNVLIGGSFTSVQGAGNVRNRLARLNSAERWIQPLRLRCQQYVRFSPSNPTAELWWAGDFTAMNNLDEAGWRV